MLRKTLRRSHDEGTVLNKSFIQLLAHCRRGDRKNVGAGNGEKSREVPSSTHNTDSVIMNLEQPQLFELVLRNSHWWTSRDMDAHGTPHLTAQLQAKYGLGDGKGDYFLQLYTLRRACQAPVDS